MVLAQAAQQVPALAVPMDLLWQLLMGVGALIVSVWGGSKLPWQVAIVAVLKKVLPTAAQVAIAEHVSGPTDDRVFTPPSLNDQLADMHDAFWCLRNSASTLDLHDDVSRLEASFWRAKAKANGILPAEKLRVTIPAKQVEAEGGAT